MRALVRFVLFGVFLIMTAQAAAAQTRNVTLYAPQFVIGESEGVRWTTAVNYMNRSSHPVTYSYSAFSNQGKQLTVRDTSLSIGDVGEEQVVFGGMSPGSRDGSTFSYCIDVRRSECTSILQTGVLVFWTTETRDPQSGQYELDLAVSVRYQEQDIGTGNVLSVVGVDMSKPGKSFVVEAEIEPEKSGTRVGIALANPSIALATVRMHLMDREADRVAETSIAIQPDKQIAKFVDELFSNNPQVQAYLNRWGHLRGAYLKIVSDEPIIISGVGMRGKTMFQVPVITGMME